MEFLALLGDYYKIIGVRNGGDDYAFSGGSVRMEAPLLESRSRIAESYARRRAIPDAEADWFAAEKEQTDTAAYYRALKSQDAAADSQANWQYARQTIRWRASVESQFPHALIPPFSRPYLALLQGSAAALASRLNEVYALNSDARTAGVLAVLDGAPETARTCRDRADSVEALAAKEAGFFEYWRHTVSLYRGKLLEAGNVRSSKEVTDGDRTFQDGGCGFFVGESATCDAVASGLELRGYLAELNYRDELHWRDELHARVVVAASWEGALRGLEFAHRDEIVIDARLFKPLPACTKRTLLAAQVRLAPLS